MNALELFKQGGFIMYPLLAFSILIWIVALQKYFFLLSFTKQYKKIDEDANRAITANRFEELRWVFKNASVLITRPHEVLFEDSMLDKAELSEKLYRRLNETQAGLKKNMWILGTIGSSAPFVGLFGTVLGIMDSFREIGISGKSGFAVVASGISESLVATASGIIVAVVAVIFYNYFLTKINQVSMDFKNRVEDIADLVFIARKMRK
ncbi:MAG: MotA/TolQ/ExbB proton channel family protein [Bacteriovoracaceae bacterium]